MSEEIFIHPCFRITEDVHGLEDSTDVATTIVLETEKDTFTFDFAYGNLIAFVRQKNSK